MSVFARIFALPHQLVQLEAALPIEPARFRNPESPYTLHQISANMAALLYYLSLLNDTDVSLDPSGRVVLDCPTPAEDIEFLSNLIVSHSLQHYDEVALDSKLSLSSMQAGTDIYPFRHVTPGVLFAITIVRSQMLPCLGVSPFRPETPTILARLRIR